MIDALYKASGDGVQVDLIVRGICALRPGVKGLSENIRVRSIVGRFLEHSRVYCFANGGEEEIFCGSADWMPRNFFERCETIFPIKDAGLRRRIREEILAAYLADDTKARLMLSDGSYPHIHTRKTSGFNAQDFFMRVAEGKTSADSIPTTPEETRLRRSEALQSTQEIVAAASERDSLSLAASPSMEGEQVPQNGHKPRKAAARRTKIVSV